MDATFEGSAGVGQQRAAGQGDRGPKLPQEEDAAEGREEGRRCLKASETASRRTCLRGLEEWRENGMSPSTGEGKRASARCRQGVSEGDGSAGGHGESAFTHLNYVLNCFGAR